MERVALYTYHYDPLDRLTGTKSALQSGRLRFYCQHRIATEIQGDAQYSIMQHGDQLLAQQTRQANQYTSSLLATDLQRSVLQTTNGAEQQTIAYSPFGHHANEHTYTHLLGFNGERADSVTGHYLLGNGYRTFNPVLMRFNSPDSWSPFGKGGINRYSYCLNNPVNYRDPSGHFFAHVSDFFALGGISASIGGIVIAISSPARTSGSAIVAYAAGALGILHGAVAASAPGTAIGAVMATSSASLGAVAMKKGISAHRSASQGLSNRGSLNSLDAMENALTQSARFTPNRTIEAHRTII